MKEKTKSGVEPGYYWLGLFAACFIAYQLVQDQFRPNYTGHDAIIRYLLGVAPNFFPGIGIPALFVVLLPQLSPRNKAPLWLHQYRNRTAVAVAMTGLIGWEFLQITTSKGRFDWHDVLWTLIGGMVFQVIWTIAPARFKGAL